MSKLNGTWNITVHTFMGDMRSILNATVEGDTITGTVTDASNGACSPIENGKVDGDKFSYQVTSKTAVGEMTNPLPGELVGDMLKGKSANGMGEFDCDATRG